MHSGPDLVGPGCALLDNHEGGVSAISVCTCIRGRRPSP